MGGWVDPAARFKFAVPLASGGTAEPGARPLCVVRVTRQGAAVQLLRVPGEIVMTPSDAERLADELRQYAAIARHEKW